MMVSAKSPSLLPKTRQRQPTLVDRPPNAKTTTTSTTSTNRGRIRMKKTKTKTTTVPEAPWVSGIKNSIASGLAAGCSKLILAPFDTIKTLQQHSRSFTSVAGTAGAGAAAESSLTLLQAAKSIMNRPRGFLEFYAGIGVTVIGSMPSVGLYFGIYSYCKKTFQRLDPHMYEQRQTLYIALSAAIGNTVASASRVPYEVVKQKFQTKVYTTMGDAIRDFSISTLFPMGGIASQMLRDVPYAVVTLLAYEHLKGTWKVRAQQSFRTVHPSTWDLFIGGTAGGIGSYVTNPMDVIKTRLQTDVNGQTYGGSIMACAQQTWSEGGPTAFLRGSVPRLLHKVPANAFFFLFYEFFRTVLRVRDDSHDHDNIKTVITGGGPAKNK